MNNKNTKTIEKPKITKENKKKAAKLPDKEYLTIEEAIEWTGTSRTTIYEWEKIGLKVIRIGSNKHSLVRIKVDAIREFLDTFER